MDSFLWWSGVLFWIIALPASAVFVGSALHHAASAADLALRWCRTKDVQDIVAKGTQLGRPWREALAFLWRFKTSFLEHGPGTTVIMNSTGERLDWRILTSSGWRDAGSEIA